MTVTFSLVLLIVAFVLFTLSAIGVSHPRVNFQSAGLACWVLALIIG